MAGHDLEVVCVCTCLRLKCAGYLDTTCLSCAGKETEVSISEVVCDPASLMSDSESLSTGVKIFMTEKEALWHEFEHGFS